MLIVFVNPVFASEITQTDSTSHIPQIHSDAEKIFPVWTERSETNAEIYFSKSIDEGLTCSNHSTSVIMQVVLHFPEWR